MKELKFRALTAEDIEVRAAQVKENFVDLLLYKNARVDQNILDETVGPYNWQRSHSRDNANCTVAIWDEEKQQWICKEDTGKESYADAEKGLASDSFKRACFNWGIGRELYTVGSIRLWANNKDKNGNALVQIKPKNNGFTTYDQFKVAKIITIDGKIKALAIRNETTKALAYCMDIRTEKEKKGIE